MTARQAQDRDEYAQRLVRSAPDVLVRETGINLAEFGSAYYLPPRADRGARVVTHCARTGGLCDPAGASPMADIDRDLVRFCERPGYA